MTASPAGFPPAPSAPTPAPRRSLTPDLARGFAMLGVLLANAYYYVENWGTTTADAVAEFAVTWLFESRSWPMFALMFGFGVAMFVANLSRRGYDRRTVNRTVRRRLWWLFLLGAVQSVLWFQFDILGIYAATALLLLPLLRWGPTVWKLVGLVALMWSTAIAASMVTLTPDDLTIWFESDEYWASVVDRCIAFLGAIPIALLSMQVLAPMLIGFGYYASGALTTPAFRLRMHRWVGFGGLGFGLVGGLPTAVIEAGWWYPSDWVIGLSLGLHMLSGVAQGAAYVSLLALLSVRLGDRPRGALKGVAAAGARSLTVYLAHGFFLAIALSPWALGWGADLSPAAIYAYATAVWVLLVGASWLMQRAGRRGPADALLRRLTYRKLPPAPANAAPISAVQQSVPPAPQ